MDEINLIKFRCSFEEGKAYILDRIQKMKGKWDIVWRKARGFPSEETELVHLKLEIQLIETKALDELKKMEDEIVELESQGSFETD